MAYVETWDETKPAGTRDRSLGDDDIREFKRAIRERLATDHDFRDDETAITTIGYHKKVTLITGSDPTQVANTGILYAKDVSAIAELHWINENGDILQITSGSAFHSRINNPLGLIAMWYGTVASIPSGWVFCNGGSSSPDLRSKFVCGAHQDDAGVAKTNVTGSLAQSGGSATLLGSTGSYTLTDSDIPAHTHTVGMYCNYESSGSIPTMGAGLSSGSASGSPATSSVGGGGGHAHSLTSVSSVPPFYALAFIMKT